MGTFSKCGNMNQRVCTQFARCRTQLFLLICQSLIIGEQQTSKDSFVRDVLYVCSMYIP